MTIMRKELKMRVYRDAMSGWQMELSGEQTPVVATVGGCGGSESEQDRV